MMYNRDMAHRQFQLNKTEIGQFRQMEQTTRDVRELKRMQGVRLYGTGVAMVQIMDTLGCGESSVREWVSKYQRGGLAALRSKWSVQNASKLTEAQRADLTDRLHQYRPDQILPSEVCISTGNFWTVSDLRIAVEQWYGVTYKDAGSYRNLLHRSGFSYQRAERIYKSRPSEVEIAEFEAELEKK
jgi:transposase